MRAELKKWQVQVRISRKHKWRAKGTFETRERAREESDFLRHYRPAVIDGINYHAVGYGFGNTRVVRKITGGL